MVRVQPVEETESDADVKIEEDSYSSELSSDQTVATTVNGLSGYRLKQM